MNLGTLQNGPKQPTENQRMHGLRIAEACELVRSYMHAAEGSTDPGEHQEHIFQTRRMAIAATQLEIAEMMAVKAALE
jgi:hypothetical protein